jgi:hypothetical protein
VTEPLPARLNQLLLRQARERGAPDWVVALLEGEEAAAGYSEESGSELRVKGPEGEELGVRVQLLAPAPPPATTGPWAPERPDIGEGELAGLSYVVVDEIVGDVADLSVSPWPEVDERGRLRFVEGGRLSVRAGTEQLRGYLARTDFRTTAALRPVRTGDVFAVKVRRRKLESLARRRAAGAPQPPSAWMIPPVWDIAGAARDKAKEAFYAAVTPTLTPQQAAAMRKVPVRTPPE